MFSSDFDGDALLSILYFLCLLESISLLLKSGGFELFDIYFITHLNGTEPSAKIISFIV